MGLSLTNTHIHNKANLTKPQFKKALTDMMKSKGYTKATEDDASVSFSLIFTKDRKWVTVLGEDINAAELAKSLDLQVLSVELVDSDFAELKLHSADSADTLMLGNPYMDEYPDPNPDKWQSILGENTWSQVEEIQSGDHTFAEDALAEFGALIGLGENILLENDDIPEGAEVMHFKKAKEKKLTLNAAFKQVFGGYLEPLGFVKIKTADPIYVRLLDDCFIQIIAMEKMADNVYRILCGVATIYRLKIELERGYRYNINWLRGISELYRNINSSNYDWNYYMSIQAFGFVTPNNEEIIASFNKALAETKKIVMPEFDKMKNKNDVVSYLCKAYPAGMDLSYDPPEGDALICYELDDPYVYIDFSRESAYKELSDMIACNECGYTEDIREEKTKEIDDYLAADRALIEAFFNDKKINAEIKKKIDDRKQRNIDILRKYGIEI
ncbi:MAG: hypothetical protein J6M17_04045 [Ruminococcus sp.]|nr:hypothetical protein [Ruminococcus sp.]